MPHKKKIVTNFGDDGVELEVTGSLLQDVTIPAIEDLGEDLQLFFSGGNVTQPQDVSEQEVNRFLSGGK